MSRKWCDGYGGIWFSGRQWFCGPLLVTWNSEGHHLRVQVLELKYSLVFPLNLSMVSHCHGSVTRRDPRWFYRGSRHPLRAPVRSSEWMSLMSEHSEAYWQDLIWLHHSDVTATYSRVQNCVCVHVYYTHGCKSRWPDVPINTSLWAGL